jgi:hypothetical protein
LNRRLFEGFEVGLIALCAGLWLVWRGLRNDIWRDLFGAAVIPRWLYITGGLALAALSAAYLAFLWPAMHR